MPGVHSEVHWKWTVSLIVKRPVNKPVHPFYWLFFMYPVMTNKIKQSLYWAALLQKLIIKAKQVQNNIFMHRTINKYDTQKSGLHFILITEQSLD